MGLPARKLTNPVEYRPLNRNIFLQMSAGAPKSRREIVIDFAVRMDLMLAQAKYDWTADRVAGIRRLFLSGVVSWRGVKEACLFDLTPEQLADLATRPEMAIPTFGETLAAGWTSSPGFGNGWGGATTTPGSGGTKPSSQHMYADGHKLDTGEGVYLGIQAYHSSGIPTVEFAIEGSDWLAVPRSKHPTRDVYGHWVYVPASAADADGVAEYRWRVTPTNGDEGRVLSGERLTFNNGGTIADKTPVYVKSEFTVTIGSKSGEFDIGETVIFDVAAANKLQAVVVSQTPTTLTVNNLQPHTTTSGQHYKDIVASMGVTGATSTETAVVDAGYTAPAGTSGDPFHTMAQAASSLGNTADAAAYATIYLYAGTYYYYRCRGAEGLTQNDNGWCTITAAPGVTSDTVFIKAPLQASDYGPLSTVCDYHHWKDVSFVDNSSSTENVLGSATTATLRVWLDNVRFDSMNEAPFTNSMWVGRRYINDLYAYDMETNTIAASANNTYILEPEVVRGNNDFFGGVCAIFGGEVSLLDEDWPSSTGNHGDVWQQRATATDDNVIVYGLFAFDIVDQGFFSRTSTTQSAYAFVNNLMVLDGYPDQSQFACPINGWVFAGNTHLGSPVTLGLSDPTVTGLWGGSDHYWTQNVLQWVDITDSQNTRGGHDWSTYSTGNNTAVWEYNACINYGTTASGVGATGEDLSSTTGWVEGGVADRDWATWFVAPASDDFRALGGSAIGSGTTTPYVAEDRTADALGAQWAMGAEQFPAPTISSVSPDSVTNGSSGTLTFTGTGFIDGATVSVDAGLTLGSLTVNSSTEAECTYAATAVGTSTVTIENPDGQLDTIEVTVTAAGGGDGPNTRGRGRDRGR